MRVVIKDTDDKELFVRVCKKESEFLELNEMKDFDDRVLVGIQYVFKEKFTLGEFQDDLITFKTTNKIILTVK
jgi:hypothetical protein